MRKVVWVLAIVILLFRAGYLMESYWVKPPILKSSVILEYDPSKASPLTAVNCDKPKKQVRLPGWEYLIDCDGDKKVDKVMLLDRIYFVVESKKEADAKNSTELNQIRLWDNKEGVTCPDGKKDYGTVEADPSGAYRLWYCGTPEPYTGSFLSRDSKAAKNYQALFREHATRK